MSVGQIDGKIEAEGEIRLTDRFWKDLEGIIQNSPLFDELMKALKEPEPLDWYDIREYRLDDARNDFRINDFPDEGDILLVISRTGSASIKFNSRNVDSFDLETYRKIKHSYTEIYLTNTAQAGASLKLLFGRGDWELEETTPTVDLSGLLDQDNLGQITDPDKLADGIIRAAKIATHAVEAAKVAENAITETKIAPDSIDTPHLKANIVTAAKIAAGTITGDLIAANVIATHHLIAAIVTAAKIATGAVTADKIAAGTITADKYLELRNTIVFQDHDSLDDNYPFELPFEIVSEMTAIQNVKLSFDITNFRAYATGVPSGGGHTTPSGGGHTTPAGGGHTSSSGGGQTSSSTGTPSGGGHTTPSGGGHTTPAGGGHTSGGADHNHEGSTAGGGSHNHYIQGWSADTGPAPPYNHVHGYFFRESSTETQGNHGHYLDIISDGWHSHSISNHQHSVSDHQHTVSNHTHPGHTHTVSNHTHTVSNHTHTVSNHQHTVSNHTHSLTFGIYEDPQAPTINVYIDNGTGYGASIGAYVADQLDIDITSHISGAGHKRVKFESDERTKIHAWVMTKVDLTA